MSRIKKTNKSTAPNKKRQVEEILKCGKDVRYFIKNYVKIPHPIRGRIKFHLFEYQEQCLEDFLVHDKIIVNKSRQLGLSTLAAAYSLWMILFQRDRNVLVIATKLATAKNFLQKVKVGWDSLPHWLKMPKLVVETKQELQLSNGSKIKAIPTSADAGRSEALSLLIVDEAAHIEGIDDLWLGLSPTMSTGGSAILISSPSGVGTFFHNMWVGAGKDENGFHQIELPWTVHPERDEEWFRKEKANLIAAKGEAGVAQELLCLDGRTNIVTKDGTKKIKDIALGDEVLTHKGRFRKVVRLYQHELQPDETLYDISTPGNRKKQVRITGNHPIQNYSFKVPKGANNKTHFNKLVDSGKLTDRFTPLQELECWKYTTNHTRRLIYGCLFPQVGVSQLIDNGGPRKKMDLLSLPVEGKISSDENHVRYYKQSRNKKTKRYIPVDFNLGRFIGLCAAEGHIEPKRFGLAFHHSEIDTLGKFVRDFLEKLGCTFYTNKRTYSKCYTILSTNKFVRELIRHFIVDGNARTKHYSDNIYKTNPEFLKGLIVGHFEGDGDHPENHSLYNKIKVVCKSEKMLYQLKTLLCSFGHYPRLGFWNEEPSYLEIDGLLNLSPENRHIRTLLEEGYTKTSLEKSTSRTLLVENKHFVGAFQWSAVDTRKEYGKTLPIVYNIEVDEDNSYIADSLVVHNCSFMASGNTFIPGDGMEKILKNIKEPIEKISIKYKADVWIWKRPSAGNNYVIGADVSTGQGDDYSAFHIVDTTADEVVADFKGKIPPDKFAELLIEWGKIYNMAMICQELNNVGIATAITLKESKYPNLYYEKLMKNIYMSYMNKDIGDEMPGYTVNPNTREQILAKMEHSIRNGLIRVYSKRLYEEFQTFVYKKSGALGREKPQARKGHHDDLIMAFAISCNMYEASGKTKYDDGAAQWALVGGMSVNSQRMDPVSGRTTDGFFSSNKNKRDQNQDLREQLASTKIQALEKTKVHDYSSPQWARYHWLFDK